jgi:hypothetical protein
MPLTPLELIDRLAQLLAPPRKHRHRYCGVFAPNAPLRAAVAALAQAETDPAPEPADTETTASRSRPSNAYPSTGGTI